jgi:ABC-type oligopeptide transport system ATPase subunit
MATKLVFELCDALKRREQGGVAFELHIPKLALYQGQFIAVVGESGCGKKYIA